MKAKFNIVKRDVSSTLLKQQQDLAKVEDLQDSSSLYVYRNWSSFFTVPFKCIAREYSLSGDILNKQKSVGRIDFLASYRKSTFVIEVDLQSNASLWHGYKTIAYRAAYCIDTDRGPKYLNSIKTMMFLPSYLRSNASKNIMAMSHMEWVFFDRINETSWKPVESSLPQILRGNNNG